MKSFLVALLMAGGGAAFTGVAGPIINFTQGGTDPANLSSTDPFDIPLNLGAGSIVLTNMIGSIVTDFHFVVSVAQGMKITGNGGVFFSSIPDPMNSTTLDFFKGGTGNGIRIGERFSITLSGFSDVSKVTANATTVPERGTFSLMVMGLLLALVLAAFHGSANGLERRVYRFWGQKENQHR